MNDLIDQNNQQYRVNQNINDQIQKLKNAIKEITAQASLNNLMMNDLEIINHHLYFEHRHYKPITRRHTGCYHAIKIIHYNDQNTIDVLTVSKHISDI